MKPREDMPNPTLIDIPETIPCDRVVLRCPKPGDGVLLYEAVAESIAALRKYIASVPWAAAEPSVESSEIYCRTAYSNFIARKDMPYLIIERDSLALVGCVGLHRPNWETPKFEVGYWCRTAMSGRGYVTEAVQALARFAEAHLSAARVELLTDAENLKSRAVAERAGFKLEGLLRNERRAADGSLRSTCIYARTASTA